MSFLTGRPTHTHTFIKLFQPNSQTMSFQAKNNPNFQHRKSEYWEPPLNPSLAIKSWDEMISQRIFKIRCSGEMNSFDDTETSEKTTFPGGKVHSIAPRTWRAPGSTLEILVLQSHCGFQHCSKEHLESKSSDFKNKNTAWLSG